MIMKPPDNDGDDPFHHLMAWNVDQPSSKEEEEEHDENSSDADAADGVIVEDASTTDDEEEEEEGSDSHENIGINDEMKKSFVVQELFPSSMQMAANIENDGAETEAVSTSGHFNPTNSTIDMTVGHDAGQDLPNSDANDSSSIERDVDHVDSILNATVAECDANEASNPVDFNVDDSAIQHQEIIPDAPSEAKLVDSDGIDGKADDDLLLSFLDDEALVSNHQTYPLQINAWQQEQPPQQQPPQQHQQENMLAQENLLDIPLSSYDHRHSYQPPVESLVESVTDTDGEDTTTDNHLRNPTDVTVGTATITTVDSTYVNVEEDSWATHIPSAYDNNIDADRNEVEVGPTRRDLEVNYAIDKELTSANNDTSDEEHNHLDGHKISRKQKYKKRRVKQTSVNDFDEEQAVAVIPGMVAYTHLNEQDDDYGRIHSKKSPLKVPYKRRRQRRCVVMLCIVVVVLLAAIVGLLYWVIASPSVKVLAGNNDSGKVELDESIEEGGNMSDAADVGGGVNDGHLAPTTDHDLDAPLENGNGPMIDSNDHHFQHDTSSDNTASPASHSSADTILDESQDDINITASPGNHSSTGTILDESQDDINITASLGNHSSTGTLLDEDSVLSSNTTDILSLSNSSTLSHTNTFGDDVLHFDNTSFANTELSLTTTNGGALVAGISKSYGIVFDIESLVPSLTVTGMDLYLDTSFSSRYEVWMTQGSWRDGAEFVEIAHGTIDGTGVCHDVHLDNCEFAPIPGDEFDRTTILAGQRKSFWVTLRDDDLVSHNRFVGHDQDNLEDADTDTVYVTNTEMNVYYGTAILDYPIQNADPETDYRCSRGFIGKIRYKVGGASENLAEPSDVVEHTQMPVLLASEIPSAQPSIPSTNAPEEPVESCYYVTEESCREAASSLGLHLGGAGFPFAGPYSRAGCYFYSCSNCLYGGIAYFGTKGTVLDFQSTHSVHSEKRLDCNTNLYSIEDESPFWCIFPTTKCAGC